MPSKTPASATSASKTMKTTSANTAAAAARSAGAMLNLDDINRLAIALTLAAADEVEENSRFANRVRANYELLPPSKSRTTKASAGTVGSMPEALTAELTPIKRVEGGEINPTAPLDPFLLLEVYGAHQLRQALNLYSPVMLREAAAAVAERYASPRPAAKASKEKLVDFVVEHLTADATRR